MSGAALRRAPRAAARRMLALPGVLPRYLEATRRFRADAVLILAYHGVTAEALAVPNACQLALGAFERQMDLLRTQYRVLPLAEVAERLAAGRPLPPHTAVLTFDDGFRNVATTAFPSLAPSR